MVVSHVCVGCMVDGHFRFHDGGESETIISDSELATCFSSSGRSAKLLMLHGANTANLCKSIRDKTGMVTIGWETCPSSPGAYIIMVRIFLLKQIFPYFSVL